MKVVEVRPLAASATVTDAINHLKTERVPYVLARRGKEVRLIKKSQLLRAAPQRQGMGRLNKMLWAASEPVASVDEGVAGTYQLRIDARGLSGDFASFLKDSGSRLAVVRMSGQRSFLISASEEHLVDYHCTGPHQHSYEPPPAWHPGIKCPVDGWPVVRES